MKRALVVASVGSTVNLRAKPSLGSVVLAVTADFVGLILVRRLVA